VSVSLHLTCSGCFAEVRTKPWRREYQSVFGGDLCTVFTEDPEGLVPEGWVMWDPYTHATYCPACWAQIEKEE
jgi:hypothetical protein